MLAVSTGMVRPSRPLHIGHILTHVEIRTIFSILTKKMCTRYKYPYTS